MAPMSGDDWRGRLDGSDQGIRPLRRFWRSLPSPPRCKLCLRPFDGPGGAVMRMVGLGPWEKNPKYCRGCYQDIDANHGGAEVELSMLFADVRGSTGIAEGMAPLEYSHLLNRFYEVATACSSTVRRSSTIRGGRGRRTVHPGDGRARPCGQGDRCRAGAVVRDRSWLPRRPMDPGRRRRPFRCRLRRIGGRSWRLGLHGPG